MPQSLKYYDSKNYIVTSEKNSAFAQKRFEYIVQGMQAGTWQIPSQEFVFFDVIKKAYKTLKTKPLSITITSNSSMQKMISPSVADKNDGINNQVQEHLLDNLSPLDETGLWYRISERKPIPFWLFFLLSIMPILSLLIDMMRRKIYQRAALHEPILRAKKAFVIARVALEKADSQNDSMSLYSIFIQLFADRFQIPNKQVTQDFIEEQLQKSGVSNIDCTKWHDFFMHITEAKYAIKKTDSARLFAQANVWIDKLEGLL
jgi:hypothetical protein